MKSYQLARLYKRKFLLKFNRIRKDQSYRRLQMYMLFIIKCIWNLTDEWTNCLLVYETDLY